MILAMLLKHVFVLLPNQAIRESRETRRESHERQARPEGGFGGEWAVEFHPSVSRERGSETQLEGLDGNLTSKRFVREG